MKKFLMAVCLFSAVATHAQVGVGTSTPDASAQLDVSANNKGLLVPRMTASERAAISNPAKGLLVFQTDATAGFYYNAGTPATPSWQMMGAGTGSGSASMALVATITSSQTIPLGGTGVPPATLIYNNVVTANTSLGTLSGATFTVSADGIYSISASVIGTVNNATFPLIYVNNQPVAFGSGATNLNLPAPFSRANVFATLSLATNDAVQIRVSNPSTGSTQSVTTDGSTKLTIIKL